jgi:hypothetical protein
MALGPSSPVPKKFGSRLQSTSEIAVGCKPRRLNLRFSEPMNSLKRAG